MSVAYSAIAQVVGRLRKNSVREALCIRARLQSCRRDNKKMSGFSPCGIFSYLQFGSG